ncbi:hypothetical protein B0A48_07963 [Cryoendolithus antarcticus]|uniref:Major facilitator superfamily (MFS) profile domain-containing protein n=1 Tax=Cryoendolithus antarcticus TaxID=1507870 RepID=A0A1V8T0J8_9PEZI|nr:hypothetical protein B0A48_07963 [Cryoendolithus antarcticus]
MFGRGRPLRAAIYTCCLAAFLFFGYDQGVFGGILQNKHWLEQFDHPSDTITGITVASYCFGAFFGCILNIFIGDYFGRRRMIWIAMGFIFIGASLQTSAYALSHLIVGRIITGLGTGIDSSTVPMYQSELSKKENRGQVVSWEIWFIGIGIVLAYWIDYGFSYVDSDVAFRAPIGIQLIFAVVVTVIVWGLPESPRWLAKRGRIDEAREVLCAVFDVPDDDPWVLSEIRAIEAAIAIERGSGAGTVSALFKSDILQTRKRTILAWFGLFMNQWSGINLVIYYMPTVLVVNVGMSPGRAQLIAGFVELMFPIGNTLPALYLDRMGRKRTMMIVVFGATINVVPWVWGPEILPLEARAKGTAVSVSSHWIWNACIVLITPILINRIGWKTYLIFMILLALFVPGVWYFYPETSGLSLEEIDNIFLPEGRKVNPGEYDAVLAGDVTPDSEKGGLRRTEEKV